MTCDGGDFESLITAAIPITESFGNATTSRNNNSSRFAKFIELLYTADGYVDGAVISTYLLETVRVVHQSSGERNFHVFYELFAGLTAAQRNEWRFPSLESFMYTNQSNTYTRHDGVEDKENFVKLEDAMNKMNITDFEQEDIFKLLISILHMGNIRFKESDMMGDEGAVFDNASVEHVECVCEFTGLQQDALLKAMTKRGLTVAGTEVHKSLNVTAAAVSRDAMAQHLYELIFTSMIRDINTTIALEDSSVMASFIGILDISGFEHFKTNSFEQLCINYSNEKLQSHFNFSVFVSEREVYLQEGLVWSCDSYPDNSAMLDLFENKSNGIFSLCDEQLKMPRPTDEQLYSSLVAKCSSNKFFDTNKSGKVKKEFMVIHFAVDVIYDTTGFLAKNRNEIASDVVNSFASSVLPILEKIRGVPNQRSALLRRALSSFQSAPTKATAIVNKKTVTLASQFIKNLQNLMSKIRTTRSHFIRCIKPNASLVANSFDCLMIMKQLRSGGALDTLRVFKTGFSNRMDFQVFSTRYALFLTICGFNTLTRGFVDFIKLARQTGSARHWKSAAHHLIDIIPITCLILNWLFYGEHERSCGTSFNAADVRNGLHVGRTQIFCRAQMFEYLELLRKMALEHVVQSLQRRRKARILSGAPCDKSLQRALLATHAVIYFSDFRQRKARKHVCATFIIQRRYRVYRAVSRRKLSLWSVVQIHCIVRRFLARLHVKRLKCLLVIRRRAQARRIQRIWKVHHRTVKVTAAAKVDAADQLKDKAAQIALLTNDIDRLQACQKELLRENEVLRERIETLTATTSTLTTTSPEEVGVSIIKYVLA